MNYVPLNIKTEYSLLTSLIKFNELVLFAKKNNIDTLTITDNNMFGVMEAYELCEKNDIKLIIGLEINISDKPIILYAINNKGYHNLVKLSTMMSEQKLELDDLEKYSNDILAIIPFESAKYYPELAKFVQYVFKGYKNSEERSSYTGKNCVYMNEIRYLKSDDDKYLTILYDIKDGKTIGDTVVKQSDKYLKLYDEIKDIYPDDLDNNQKINDLCEVKIETSKNLLPIYKCPDNLDAYSYLKKLCIQGLKNRFGNQVNIKYQERLKYELEIINKMGFCNYFLVVWDYIKFAKENDVLVGPGRGSAAGSLVSYLLNITSIDPLKYDLLFERFLNPERISMPDIDIDFADNKRDLVINYCTNKYGSKKVAGIITFATLKAKQVIRDVGRVLEAPTEKIDKITKFLDVKYDLITNYNNNIKLKEYINSDRNLMKLYKISLELEGLKRQTSIHAAGIVMCEQDLDEVIPLNLNNGFYTTGYSMQYLEKLGLLKMDFLSLRNLTLIDEVIKMLREDGIDINFDTIPDDDKEAINIFTSVNTEGIFQFESSGMKNFLRKFKPNSFEEIAAALALFRPGPMNNIDIYIKRKRGLEPVTYLDSSLEDVLKPTYGIMIYQEQIMQVASIMAGYSLGEADLLRKAMSKKQEDVLKEEEPKFISQSIKRGYKEEIAKRAYQDILKFASYGFNRAHSIAYAVISYRMAYLKAHYPKYFMGALMTMVTGSSIKTKDYIYEAKLNNINILPPNINYSDSHYLIEKEGIRIPFNNIKNVGESAIKTIIDERNKDTFSSIYDFISRTYGRGVNRKTLESLIDAGCFDSFGYSKHTLHENLDLLINYGEITKDVGCEFVDKPELTNYDEYSKNVLMSKELEIFGFYLHDHPVTSYKLKNHDCIDLNNLNSYFDKVINAIFYVDKIKYIETKKKETMCFITGTDETTNIDVVLFPKVYKQYSNIEVGDIVRVNAKVEKRFDKLQLVVNRVDILESLK